MKAVTIVCRILNTVSILAILFVSVLILRRIPPPFPTHAEIAKADNGKDWKLRDRLRGQMPAVVVEGTVSVAEIEMPVDVLGSVSIDGDVSLSDPVDVKITDVDPGFGTKPLPVHIEQEN